MLSRIQFEVALYCKSLVFINSIETFNRMFMMHYNIVVHSYKEICKCLMYSICSSPVTFYLLELCCTLSFIICLYANTELQASFL